MKDQKNKILIILVLLTVFILGYSVSLLFHRNKPYDKNIKQTEILISDYTNYPFSIDSIENLSVLYYDTANLEMIHYVIGYNKKTESQLPDYYITRFNDTIQYNKENFFYYVAMYKVAENLMLTRECIINGLLLNAELNEENKIRTKVEKK